MERQVLNKLPVEIVEEILHQLPVKSLLRFKCVSKSWRSSISSRGFIKEHLNKSNSGTDFANHNLIFNSYYYDFADPKNAGSCRIGSLLTDNDDNETNPFLGSSQNIPIPIPDNKTSYHISGSCNGLILLIIWAGINHRILYLWNPSTRKATNIPEPSCPTLPERWDRWGCGLGYHELTDDYRVICNFNSLMFIYSSRTNSWKKIENFDEGYMIDGPATFVNGRLHWLTQEENLNEESTSPIRWNIVSFDLVEEKYQIVAPPPHCGYSEKDRCLWPALRDLGGYLSFVCYKRAMNASDVWVLKKESWSKVWTFPYKRGLVPRPLWLKKNGDIVVALGSVLVIYRGKDESRHSSFIGFFLNVASTVYVASLVSPFSDDAEQLCQ